MVRTDSPYGDLAMALAETHAEPIYQTAEAPYLTHGDAAIAGRLLNIS